jgi:aryl-alcohol dehydrogenase-like predicted oxidoreductase
MVLYDDASVILELAQKNRIETIDTAIAYGNSEEVLGNIGVEWCSIITKLPEAPAEIVDIKSWIQNQIKFSMKNLGVTSLYAVMLHTTPPLSTNNGDIYWNTLQELREQGVIQKTGYSIYEPTELDKYYEKYQPDIIQSPYNILDNRLKESGWLQKLNDESVEVHVRSIFLQGLLLMNKKQRPQYFNQWSDLWQKWDQWLQDENITALQATLGFVMNEKMIDNIVIGVESSKQLKEILATSKNNYKISGANFSNSDTALLNPSKWAL